MPTEGSEQVDKCGTYAGYNQHRRDRTPTCPACRAAATDYQRKRRAENPDIYDQEKFLNGIRGRALWRLASLHPDEFQALVAEELERFPI